jgi:UDP-N-acetyl-D-glucosamine dehydrogenase
MKVIIVGLGYVGLPLAVAAAEAGFAVVGLDKSPSVVADLNKGISHIKDVPDSAVSSANSSGFQAVAALQVGEDFDVAVICVPTPLAQNGLPDLSYIEESARHLGTRLKAGCLVILESTTYPGTTQEVLIPILEQLSGLRADFDFHVAYSPERIDPGNPKFGLRNTPKIVGAQTEASLNLAESFYSKFIDEVVRVEGLREAETAKLLENTFRHVNIALVNEMAMFCHEMGIDIWKVVDAAATKPFGFQAFYPGPGVGGHCIPIDPNYLSYKVKAELGYPFEFVETAQSINTRMPNYVFDRIREILNQKGLSVLGSKITVVGVSYKKDSADLRESPAIPLMELLQKHGARVSYHDPNVPKLHLNGESMVSLKSLAFRRGDVDVTVILRAHSEVDFQPLIALKEHVFDTTNEIGLEASWISKL